MSENRYTPTHFTAPRPAALPYLAVADARRALELLQPVDFDERFEIGRAHV